MQLDTRQGPLPRSMSQLYLADLQAWLADACRRAIRQHGTSDPSAPALLEALYGGGSSEGFARWGTIGPHVALRHEHRLSEDAMSLLLFAAAPKLWGGFAHVFAAITGRLQLDQHTLAMLHGDRGAVVRELVRDAPLVAFGLVTVRPMGAIRASADVICRLAGN
jgi:hypothetical protein